jgi:hypothetical protein
MICAVALSTVSVALVGTTSHDAWIADVTLGASVYVPASAGAPGTPDTVAAVRREQARRRLAVRGSGRDGHRTRRDIVAVGERRRRQRWRWTFTLPRAISKLRVTSGAAS